MGWCGVLRTWLTVTVPLLVCMASEDDSPFLQRQVTFDLSRFLNGGSAPESDIEPSESEPDAFARTESSSTLTGRQRIQIPTVSFPPARPSLDNLPFLCSHVDSRPRYTRRSFPSSGYGSQIRQADTMNRVESWYSGCCQGNETQESAFTLCCAQQAWESALATFCDEEFSIKTNHYHCCLKRGHSRWSCFEKAAPNPTYIPQGTTLHIPPPQEPGFIFNRSICLSNDSGSLQERDKSYEVPYIPFPPGRPNSENVDAICGGQAERPLYPLKCLPSDGYGWLARQFKVINQLETGMHRCCKAERTALACVEKKWQDVMDWFCKEEQSVDKGQDPCCQLPEQEERYACFSRRAPNPHYMILQRPLRFEEGRPLRVCDTHALIVKKFSVAFPIDRIVSECCHLLGFDKMTCVDNRLDSMLDDMCAAKVTSPSDLHTECCLQPSSHWTSNCLTRQLLKAISKAIQTPIYRSRKCPDN
ncbi:extracellular matrix protein 1-like [Brienomyrus brachyistius]|uniref:extracellular matrix protein 1-like n=1 Tax=Brienomyrus brachyistius TaxID=42636 RepID=UPI0020B1F562|nr:extracellular matrix protein 1-like [Brienomyrus brachyistius]